MSARGAAATRSVVVDCFPERLPLYRGDYTIVAVDVHRTTTTLVTAAVLGRRCFPAATIEDAVALATEIPFAVLGGELGGNVPFGFEIDNSPSAVASRADVERPLVLLSTSGTRLICHPERAQTVYAASLRNWSAQVEHLVGRHPKVAVLGAGAREQFRPEDALCCAWIAGGLVDRGYEPENAATGNVVEKWRHASVDAIATGGSAAFLRRSGRHEDLAFALDHVDDVDAVLRREGRELVLEPAGALATVHEVPA